MVEPAKLFRTVSCIILLQCIALSDGWGKKGHAIVANIAYNRLSQETKYIVSRILFPDGNYNHAAHGFASPLEAVASWADSARFTKEYSWTAPLHYIDIKDLSLAGGCPSTSTPLSYIDRAPGVANNETNFCFFDYERDCEGGLCAAGAVMDFSKNLVGRAVSTSRDSNMLRGSVEGRILRGGHERTVEDAHDLSRIGTLDSLKFLVHIVGDIHQPMHVSRGSDTGGNAIHVSFSQDFHPYLGRTEVQETGWNLHSVWDSGIIDKAIRTYHNGSLNSFQENVERSLSNKDDVNVWLSCPDGIRQECVSSWAKESLHEALTWAYGDEDGHDIKDGASLSDKYFLTRLPIVEKRLAAGGVRLAATLESVFSRAF